MYIRNVIFIKDEFYKLNKLDLRLMEDIKKIIKYFEILLFRPVSEQKKSDFNKKKLKNINLLYMFNDGTGVNDLY